MAPRTKPHRQTVSQPPSHFRDALVSVSCVRRESDSSQTRPSSSRWYSTTVSAATADQLNRSTACRRPSFPNRSARDGSASSSFTRSARSCAKRAGSTGSRDPSSRGSNGTSSPVTPSSTTSGMPPVARRHDGRLAGHRLEVDDAERLVDRRADEHRRVAQELDHVGLRKHLLEPDDVAALGAERARPSPRSLLRSPACRARRRRARSALRGRSAALRRAGA